MCIRDRYGSRGMKQAKDLIEGMSGLFAGGTLSEQDKDCLLYTSRCV